MHLKDLTKLQRLYLNGTQVSDASLVHLKDLTKLQRLYLNDTQVTDAGLVHLKGLTNLQGLRLVGTEVTDAGLVHLKPLTNLRYLYLANTQVSYESVKDLKQALPNVQILGLASYSDRRREQADGSLRARRFAARISLTTARRVQDTWTVDEAPHRTSQRACTTLAPG